MYVMFEGVDTSGKSTQIDILKEEFSDAVFTKEPGGTKLGEDIRELLLEGAVSSKKAELFLFLADRAEHYFEVVKPNRDKRLVFSDRGFISGIAYAKTNQKEFEFDKLVELNRLAINGDMPDIVFLFITNEDIIKERLGGRGMDNIEKRGIRYLLDVQANMQKIISMLGIECVEIDASKSVDEISGLIKECIKKRL